MRSARTVFYATVAAMVLAIVARADAPFVRGDTNADGVLDIIDAENICSFLFAWDAGAASLPCRDACDVNDDGKLNIADPISLLGTVFGGKAIPEPSSPGEDATLDALDCASWAAAPPVAEGGTLIVVGPCTIPGGVESYVETQVFVSSDVAVNSAQFTLELEGVPGAELRVNRAEKGSGGFITVAPDGQTIGFVPSLTMQELIQPGGDTAILNLVICVPAGTPAGTYFLHLSNGRVGLIDDLNAHTVLDNSSEVLVQSAVTDSACIDPTPPAGTVLPMRSNYRLLGPSSLAADAETVTLTLEATSDLPVVSFDVALDFSEAVFTLQSVEKTFAAGGGPAKVFDVEVGPSTCETVINDVCEGFVALHVEPADPAAWEVKQWHEVAKLTFALRRPPAELYGKTSVVFRLVGCNGGVGPDGRLKNKMRVLLNGAETEGQIDVQPDGFSIGLPGGAPPTAEGPMDVVATFGLSEGAGAPGDTGIPVYFFIESNSAIQGFSAGFTYDASILAVESATLLANISGEKPDFQVVNVYAPEGQPDAPHGVTMGVVFDFRGGTLYYAAPGEPAACARFSILPDAREGAEGEITFVNDLGTPPVENVVVFDGNTLPPGTERTEIRVNVLHSGRVLVLGEVTPFLRGDANTDYRLNIADAITMLSFLFTHGQALKCPDAADANDDGTIDIADPITTLYALFTPRKEIRPPYPGMGPDPTADSLGVCRY